MIVDHQTNLKVHFAGAESLWHVCAFNLSNIKYTLFTVFPFISKQFGIRHFTVNPKDLPIYDTIQAIQKPTRHQIMDSGLFTLMFGAHAGKHDESFIYKWQDAIVEFVHKNKYVGTMVEVDCQKVLGVKEAWVLRERLAEQVSNRLINVFHYEDGKKGLDRLIEYSDYLAISVPELRGMGKSNQTYRLASYIKNKKPNIDIHLLGCTEKKLLQQCKFCSSSDSTTWSSSVRYGAMHLRMGERSHIGKLSKEIKGRYEEPAKRYWADHKMQPTDNSVHRVGALVYQLKEMLASYTMSCGDQT